MTKKEKRTYHKPKPRLAVYGGIAGSAVTAAGVGPLARQGNLPYDMSVSSVNKKTAVLRNTQVATTTLAGAAAVAAPAVVGVVASVAADKLGVNRVLAKAKAPFRI